MILPALLLGILSPGASAAPPSSPAVPLPTADVLAVRVGRAETIANGAIEHAVILIENGKISIVGEDLPVERGIRVLDRPEWVAMPGLVNCYSRIGIDSRSSGGFEPQRKTSVELYPGEDVWQKVLDAGVTTLGIVPEGKGIPGQAVAIRPRGKTVADMIVADSVFLAMEVQTDAGSKKMVREAFEKADAHLEKEKKAREKWDEEQEKKKSKSKSKSKDDDKDKDADKSDEKKDEKKDEGSDTYTPLEIDPKVQPFLDLRAGKLSSVIRITRASDWLHMLDALGKEEFEWSVRVPLQDDIDIWNVAAVMGEREARVVLEPTVTLRAHTRREINIPNVLSKAGAKVAFVPTGDNTPSFERWLTDVALLVGEGLDRDVALRAVTLEPATVLGLEARLGSLEAGKDANLVFLSGDPFDAETRIEAVMLEGEFVSGEVNQ